MSGPWEARFHCENCFAHFRSIYHHPTLGTVCPICLRPFRGSVTNRPKVGAVKRHTIMVRDGWKCQICGGHVDSRGVGEERPSLDHIVPVSQGGSNKASNLRLAHQRCNAEREFTEGRVVRRKRDRTLADPLVNDLQTRPFSPDGGEC